MARTFALGASQGTKPAFLGVEVRGGSISRWLVALLLALLLLGATLCLRTLASRAHAGGSLPSPSPAGAPP